MSFITRYIGLLGLRCGIFDKVKATFYVTLYYIMYLLKIEELGFVKGVLTLRDPYGTKLIITDLNAKSRIYALIEIFVEDCYELSKQRDDVFVLDFGANVGMFLTGLIYHGWHPSYYIGIEPMAENLELLSKTISGVMRKGTYNIIPKAVTEKGGEKKEFLYMYGSSRSTEFCNDRNRMRIEEIDTISLKEVLKIAKETWGKSNCPIFFKIDIEGGEWEIQNELVKFLEGSKRVKYLKGELHIMKKGSKFEQTADELIDRLKNSFDIKSYKDYKGATITISGIRKSS